VGGWIIRTAARSTWLVSFVAVCFVPISLFMVLRWVFPILGILILIGSISWLLKLKFTPKVVEIA
jgi:hypothetical protein